MWDVIMWSLVAVALYVLLCINLYDWGGDDE